MSFNGGAFMCGIIGGFAIAVGDYWIAAGFIGLGLQNAYFNSKKAAAIQR